MGMRDSKYGAETLLLWEGCEEPGRFELPEVPSTFWMETDLQGQISAGWEKALQSTPDLTEGMRWRFEGIGLSEGRIRVDVSPTLFSWHYMLREVQGMPMECYPNPLDVHTLQVTCDGFIVIGIMSGSDLKGLCGMGSGFIDRETGPDGKNCPAESLLQAAERECLEETLYQAASQKDAMKINDARVLDFDWGSGHETAASIYMPLAVGRKCIAPGNNEFSDVLFLPTDKGPIYRFLNEAGLKGIPAADHLLAGVESYYRERYINGRIRQ